MRIEKTLVFEEDDKPMLNILMGYCNQAMSFFSENRMKFPEPGSDEDGHLAIRRLQAGHGLTFKHMHQAVMEVAGAYARVSATEPSPLFPEELKIRYQDNLKFVLLHLRAWGEALI